MPIRPPKEYFEDPNLMQRIDPQLAAVMRKKMKIDAMPEGVAKEKALKSFNLQRDITMWLMAGTILILMGSIVALIGWGIFG